MAAFKRMTREEAIESLTERMERYYTPEEPGMGGSRCWTWSGWKRSGKEPRISVPPVLPHATAKAAAWFLENGRWPKGNLVIQCGNSFCINPRHMKQTAPRRAGGAQTPFSQALTASALRAVRKRWRLHLQHSTTKAALAAEFGVCPETIRNAIRGLGDGR